MPGFQYKKWSILLLLSSFQSFAHENPIVDHHDYVQIDESLTLSQVVDLTLEQFPAQSLHAALKQEASALQQRGESLLAGAPSIGMRYQDDFIADDTGAREIEAELELPLWNWGQRSAGQAVAEQAESQIDKQSALIKLQVAGLVRNALWNMQLKNLSYDQAHSILDISNQLLSKIKRRVDLGDLPRTDLLLAQSDHLQKRSSLLQAEADMMRSRKSYINLTQMTRVPANYVEQLSEIKEITEQHPRLSAINTLIKRKQAELHWVKSEGSGQTSFILGGKSEKDSEIDDDIESISVEISIPFGGSAHLAPEIASANLLLSEALADRSRIFRQLEQQHHDANHALEITEMELKIANELKQIAEEHLKKTRLSFSAGEINLIDLLKIQGRSHNAIRRVKEQEVILQRNIAMYNQVVGVQP